jgi:hypothetical protein
MTDCESITYGGRRFSSEELALIRQATADYAALGITEIARTICEWLDWKRPNGRLKNHECRLLLERLRDKDLLHLPPVRRSGRHGPRTPALNTISDPQPLLQAAASDMEPLSFRLVDKSNSALFRQFVQRYHYLGYRTALGASLRYFVYSRSTRPVACLQWSSPAWTMAARDRWIGWSPAQRARNLQYIVNNSRFLILPWIQVKGLASMILSRAARELQRDWPKHYGYSPLLLETLVDSARFRGTSYLAANWICVGETTGRGRMDRRHQALTTTKRIFLFPLHRNVKQRLCTIDSLEAVSTIRDN